MLTIAIIEDNNEYARLLANYLKNKNGLHVEAVYHFASDAYEGLLNNSVDIAIVDVGLPDMCGIELVHQLKLAGCNSKYLMLTMHNSDEIIFKALHAGANGYLLKNVSPEKILESLNDLAQGHTPISPFVCTRLINHFQHKFENEQNKKILSTREKEVMHHVSRGLLYKEIAVNLGIEKETVKKHLSKIYEKLNVQNKIEAINKFFGQ